MQQETAPLLLSNDATGHADSGFAARVIAAASDLALLIDKDGVVRDVSVSTAALPRDGFAALAGRAWADTVTGECRVKVDDMLRDARENRPGRWREINQQAGAETLPLRFMAIPAGQDHRVVVIGRDWRETQELQGRVMQAQQAMERDYARLRQAETRYRVLFHTASEAVLIADAASRKIIEANPAAAALFGEEPRDIAGRPFERLFHAESRERAAALLTGAAAARRESAVLHVTRDRQACTATASAFRQDGGTQILICLAPERAAVSTSLTDAKLKLLRVLNRIPDAFVLTDESLAIVEVNVAFIELTELPSSEAARGEKLSRFLGRPGADLKLLTQTLRDSGWVRNFRTQTSTVFGEIEEVDVAAVSVPDGLEACYGFVIRSARSLPAANAVAVRELPRTAEQVTQLVGRVSLRSIVAETTEVIEQMCIEAALKLTNNNRAAAAEILGVSRQSLYAKLNRQGGRAPGDFSGDL